MLILTYLPNYLLSLLIYLKHVCSIQLLLDICQLPTILYTLWTIYTYRSILIVYLLYIFLDNAWMIM
jgi:hypothetical protein